MRITRVVATGTLTALVAGLLTVAPAEASLAPEPPEPYTVVATATFNPVTTTPDFRQSYVVPAGADALLVQVSGAAGAHASNSTGGRGGRTWALVRATPGQTFTLLVGDQGDQGGGGASSGTNPMGHGGGASYLWSPSGDLLVVSGGGGGAGYGNGSPGADGQGALSITADPLAGTGIDADVQHAVTALADDWGGGTFVGNGGGGGGYIPGDPGMQGNSGYYTFGASGGTGFAAASVYWEQGANGSHASANGAITVKAVDYAFPTVTMPTPTVETTTATTIGQKPAPTYGITGLAKGKDGRYAVRKSKTYKVYYVSKTRPRLLFATPAPGKPYKLGPKLKRSGSVNGVPRWVVSVRIDSSTRVFKKWNIGVRAGKTTKVIALNVR